MIGWRRQRMARLQIRSSTTTAIELSEKELVAHKRVLAAIERPHLKVLSATDNTEEEVGQDFPDQTVDRPNRVKVAEATSQLLKQLGNIKERIESEHLQSLNLLDKLHVRRIGLEEERSKLESLISNTMDIAEQKASSRQ
uniref:Uncharacterized protein n=1 Tax=Ditylenchus dipsaci TaxID=166011 RepID=A0A915D9V6_9BILA